jgi:hypothetical protein
LNFTLNSRGGRRSVFTLTAHVASLMVYSAHSMLGRQLRAPYDLVIGIDFEGAAASVG